MLSNKNANKMIAKKSIMLKLGYIFCISFTIYINIVYAPTHVSEKNVSSVATRAGEKGGISGEEVSISQNPMLSIQCLVNCS